MKRRPIVVLACIVLVFLAVCISLYQARQNPTSAFNDMLATNLSTPGVTRVFTQSGSGLSVAQYTQLNFGAHPTARALTIFMQGSGSIATEQIGDQTHDFVRYQKIVTTAKNAAGKPIDASSVVGKWAALQANSAFSSSVTSGLFEQSLAGILPIANLQPADRTQILADMHNDQVFTFTAKNVKTVQLDGRKTYQYAVSIRPGAYIAMMQHFGKLVGAKGFDSLNPNDYAAAEAISATVWVDARSHELAQVEQGTGGRVERYVAFGVASNPSLPKATLTTTELAKRVTELQ